MINHPSLSSSLSSSRVSFLFSFSSSGWFSEMPLPIFRPGHVTPSWKVLCASRVSSYSGPRNCYYCCFSSSSSSLLFIVFILSLLLFQSHLSTFGITTTNNNLEEYTILIITIKYFFKIRGKKYREKNEKRKKIIIKKYIYKKSEREKNISREKNKKRKTKKKKRWKKNTSKCCQLRKCVASGYKRRGEMHQIDGFTVLVARVKPRVQMRR